MSFLSAAQVVAASVAGGLGLDPLTCFSLENVIRENQWGGVDIRRGGVPVLRSNLICFGYSDGVVVGDEGKGLIEGNTIYGEEHLLGEGSGVQSCLGGWKPRTLLCGSDKVVAFPCASETWCE